MINLPIDLDATMTDTGIDLIAWVGDWDLENNSHLSWTYLIESLFEAHVVPSYSRKVIMNAGDYAYLCDVMTGLREAASKLEEQLDQVELLEG